MAGKYQASRGRSGSRASAHPAEPEEGQSPGSSRKLLQKLPGIPLPKSSGESAPKPSEDPVQKASGNPPLDFPQAATLNHQQAAIVKWLRQVRFRKTLFGVDEADVWKKLAELNELYEAALSAERARYDALLQERTPPRRADPPNTGKAGDDHEG